MQRKSRIADKRQANLDEHALSSLSQLFSDANRQTVHLHHPKLGPVALDLGEAGNSSKSYRDGYGAMHVLARRMAEGKTLQQAADELAQVVLAASSGELTRFYGSRVDAERDGHTAVLSKERHGEQEAWVITGFRNDADAQERATRLAQGYAPVRFGSREEVGAAINQSIDRILQASKLAEKATALMCPTRVAAKPELRMSSLHHPVLTWEQRLI